MKFDVMVLPGDGIGPEVVEQGVKLLNAISKKSGHTFNFEQDIIGGAAIDSYGVALKAETAEKSSKADAILFGAVGGPKWDDPTAKVRPEDGLLAIRKALGVFANIRPVKSYSFLKDSIPLKSELVDDIDLIMIRELTGGLYFGKPKKQWTNSRGRVAVDTLKYTEKEITRILRVGFELARGRNKKLTSVDKANVLESSRLWRQIAIELSAEYPDVKLEHQLVDSCTMQLIQNPRQFDVMVMENTFGDILSDEGSVLAGSLGMLPSASLSGIPSADGSIKAKGLYEPIHGTAPDIAGQGKANPIATILSVALLLRYSLGLPEEAKEIEAAVDTVLAQGYRTADIGKEEEQIVTTEELANKIIELATNY